MHAFNLIFGLTNVVLASALFWVLKDLCSAAGWPITTLTYYAQYTIAVVVLLTAWNSIRLMRSAHVQDALNCLILATLLVQSILLLSVASQLGSHLYSLHKISV